MQHEQQLIGMRQLMKTLGIRSRRTIYTRMRKYADFPRPRREGRVLRWLISDVHAYMASLPEATFDGTSSVRRRPE